MRKAITITYHQDEKQPWIIRYPVLTIDSNRFSNTWTERLTFTQALETAANLRVNYDYLNYLEILVMQKDGVFVVESENDALLAILKYSK
jgi:hypothetical protein